jgi:hypothetical protein
VSANERSCEAPAGSSVISYLQVSLAGHIESSARDLLLAAGIGIDCGALAEAALPAPGPRWDAA